jgi:uncharacterized protein YjbI with pentapeptide repeats
MTKQSSRRIAALGMLVGILVNVPAHADCGDKPKPQVDWTKCTKMRLVLRNNDLSGAVLQRTNLSSTDLAGAKLQGAVLVEAIIDRARLREADLTGSDLTKAQGSRVNFQKANLAGVTLKKSELLRADFSNANLENADLSKAELGRAVFAEADLNGAISVIPMSRGRISAKPSSKMSICLATTLIWPGSRRLTFLRPSG